MNSNTLLKIFVPDNFILATLSNVKKKSIATYKTVDIRPVKIKGEMQLQFSYFYSKKVIHENYPWHQGYETLEKLLKGYFKQAMFYTIKADYHILSNKKGQLKIIESKATKKRVETSHNKKKSYLLEEGKPCDFLIELGIMNKDGKVFKKNYAKFRQINKYLEFLNDALTALDFDKTIKIVDFGCGKAYLTFAMYYYLVTIKKAKVDIVGLDLKADVINHLNEIKARLGYSELTFLRGHIADFTWHQNPDVVVSLHACDTATDDALYKAISWDAKVIMAVPCCHHEAFEQLNNTTQIPLLKHGIIKEKFASLLTDSIRAALLETIGYQTTVMEFIDMAHTPKNIMIKAIKKGEFNKDAYKKYTALKNYWHVNLKLEKLLANQLPKV